MKLYVGKLPFRTTEQELHDLFSQYGEVLSTKIIADHETGRSRGFGFVEMSNDSDALNAISQLHNSLLEGRNIVVNEAQEKPARGNSYQNRDRGFSRDSYNDRRY